MYSGDHLFPRWINALAPVVGGEMTDLGARTRQIGTFPVFLENISPAQNAGLPERLGPLGVVPTCIVRLIAFNTLRCSDIHARRERSTFLHKKRVPGLFFGFGNGFPKLSLTVPTQSKRTMPVTSGGHHYVKATNSVSEPGLTFTINNMIQNYDAGLPSQGIFALDEFP